MLSQVFVISLHAIALAGLSAVLLWLLPEAYLGAIPRIRRGLGHLGGWLEREDEPPQGTRSPTDSVWPRISGPA